MRQTIFSAFCFLWWLGAGFSSPVFSQTAEEVIATVNSRVAKVNDYRSQVNVVCQIPFIRIDPINAKVIYKKPDKFRVKAEGLLILPRQNPGMIFQTLNDTEAYTAVLSGAEKLGAANCKIISIIPNVEGDLVLGKFWIDPAKGLVMRSQLTTKENGTVLIEFEYGSQAQYCLPDKMVFLVDTRKFKLPKALATDMRNHSDAPVQGDEKGKIIFTFFNYVVNKGVNPSEFTDN